MISADGFRYAVGRVGVDLRTLRPQANATWKASQESEATSGARSSSAEWQDAELAAALAYVETLEGDPECDELTLVAARHQVMLRRRALAEEIARDS